MIKKVGIIYLGWQNMRDPLTDKAIIQLIHYVKANGISLMMSIFAK